MSGVEIAGLALGVLPVFISAAEHYREGLDFVKRAIRRKDFIKQYKDELALQRTLLALYLKSVIGKTALCATTQSELVENPTGKAWYTPEVVAELSKQLGEARPAFASVVARICALLAKHIRLADADRPLTEEDVVDKLQGLSLDAAKASEASETEKIEVRKRLKFSWKHPERTALLSELKACNGDLEKLNKALDGAKLYERKQQSRRAHETFKLRDTTEQLYTIICRSCSCQPSKSRDVSLGLQVHTHRSRDESEPCFHMLLFDTNRRACELTATISNGHTPPQPKKKVRLDIASDALTNSRCKKMKKLIDLCKEHKLAQESKGHLQLLVDEKGEAYTLHDPPKKQLPPKGDQVLSLSDLMSTLQLYDRKTWLHREKAILAVILSYSLLQLHESSWLQSQWNSKSITFLDLGLDSLTAPRSPDQRVKLRQPYTRSIASSCLDTAETPANVHAPKRRNAHIHALGVLLVELYLNRSIDTDVAAQGGSDYRGVAQDLLEEHSDDFTMKPEYLRAVRFCLAPHPNPYTGSFSFEDEGFREIFYEEVISKLEDNLMANFGISDGIWQVDQSKVSSR